MKCEISLKPLGDRATLKDDVYLILQEAILDADIYGVTFERRLDERQLAQQFGISRTPLREALTRLEHDGLVKIMARKGVYLLRKSCAEIVKMITVWATLESMAARLACKNALDSDIDSQKQIGETYTTDSAKSALNEYS